MSNFDENLKKNIKDNLYMHGQLSILFYKMNDEWIIHKWGEYSNLEKIQEKVYDKYRSAGFIEEADTLTLMELPRDEELIFKVLTCDYLPSVLKELGLI